MTSTIEINDLSGGIIEITNSNDSTIIEIAATLYTIGPEGPQGIPGIPGMIAASDYTDLAECITALGTVDIIDLAITRAEAFSGTIPSNYRLHFYANGEITVADSDVTIDGEIVTAGLKRIFNYTGSGVVSITRDIDKLYPEWWGAVGTDAYVTDSGAAIIAALACLESRGFGLLQLTGKEYRSTLPIVYPAGAITITGPSKSSAGGTLELTSSVIQADHTSGPAVWLTGENNQLLNITIDASATRQAGDINQIGVLLEPEDTSSAGVRGAVVQNVTSRYHSGHGIMTSGNCYQSKIDHVMVRGVKGHGIYLDDGTDRGMTNIARPGQISIINPRVYNVGGHTIKAWDSTGYGVYRLRIENMETSEYFAGQYNAALFEYPASAYIVGENVIIENSAFSGNVNGVKTLASIYTAGRVVRIRSLRSFYNLDHAVQVGQGTPDTADVVIDGVIVEAARATALSLVNVDTGVEGVTVINQETNAHVTPVSGDLSKTIVIWNGGIIVSRNIESRTFTSVESTAEFPFSATKTDVQLGIEFTRTGTGASVARFMAAGGGAMVSNSINNMIVKNTTINIKTLPTSSAGLSVGDLWIDTDTIKIKT